MVDDNDKIIFDSDMGQKLIVALQSIRDPSVAMQTIAQRETQAVRNELTARIDAIENANNIWHDDLVRVPTEVQKAVANVREILETRIVSAEAVSDSLSITITRYVDVAISSLAAIEDAKIAGHSDALEAIRKDIDKRFEQVKESVTECVRDVRDTIKITFAHASSNLESGQNLQEEKTKALSETVQSLRGWVNDRLDIMDKATIKAAADVKSAVDAAFAAAATGVSQQNQANFLASQKQEAAFTKALDTLALNVASSGKASDDKLNDIKKNSDEKVNDLKDRIVIIESRTSVSDPTTANRLNELSNSITRLRTNMDSGVGEKQGSNDFRSMIGWAVAIGVGAIAIMEFLSHLGVSVVGTPH